MIKLAEKFITNHACQGGGWNHGNDLTLGSYLPPYRWTTAEALLALQDIPRDTKIEQALTYLKGQCKNDSSSLSLALSILALTAYDQDCHHELSFLLNRQAEDGSFGPTTLSTAISALALEAAEGTKVLKIQMTKAPGGPHVDDQSNGHLEEEDNQPSGDEMPRRHFLKVAITASIATGTAELLSSCNPASKDSAPSLTRKVPDQVTEAQRLKRRQGRSAVAIVPVSNYEENIFAILKKSLHGFAVPDLKGQTVVLKPNMVEYQPGKPVTTNPAMIKAAILLAWDWGAKEVIVAEGPGHMRDTEYLLHETGIGGICKEMAVPFVDLNLDQIEKVDNIDGFTGLKEFWLPKTIARADAVISLPKLKTHHWVGVTCSMKNLFGTVPGRKYGWPKNLLHVQGIPHSIIDLQHLVKPRFAIVDAVTTMEGDGPINGNAKHLGYVVLGDDLAAVDATCLRLMKLDPHDFPYIRLAGKVVGNIEEEMIDISGPVPAAIATAYAMPITFTDKSLLSQAAQQGS